MSEKLAYIVIYIFVFTIGSCLGSFMNVIIYRLPKEISFVKGRSHCPNCNRMLPFYDMIPVFSWFILRGKCRKCKTKISFRYPLVELLIGTLAVCSVLRYNFTIKTLIVFFVAYLLVGISFIDWDTMEIPNGFHLFLILPCITSLIFLNDMPWYERIIGFFVVSLPMFLLTFLVDGSFGGGDIKLMAVCGFILGWKITLISTFVGFILGGLYASFLLIAKKSNRKTKFAFGPFLCIGITSGLFYGNELVDIYLNLFYYVN